MHDAQLINIKPPLRVNLGGGVFCDLFLFHSLYNLEAGEFFSFLFL